MIKGQRSMYTPASVCVYVRAYKEYVSVAYVGTQRSGSQEPGIHIALACFVAVLHICVEPNFV
jgi:hypothetical protein